MDGFTVMRDELDAERRAMTRARKLCLGKTQNTPAGGYGRRSSERKGEGDEGWDSGRRATWSFMSRQD